MTMPNIEIGEMTSQQFLDTDPFPLVLKSGGESLTDSIQWVQSQRADLDQKVQHHGAILFQGFGLETDQDFDAFVGAFDYPNFSYADSLSNAVRVNRTERVFTANEAPAEVTICLHHEMAQTPMFPSRLFFFCEQPADTGGATPLCRSDVLLERLNQEHPEFVAACRAKGLRYRNVMPAEDDPNSGMGRSWQSTLSVNTKEAAEDRLRQLGYEWQWQDDDSLQATTPKLDAVRSNAVGREAFFNQLIAASQGWKDTLNDPSKAVTHGDGSQLDNAAVLRAAELAEDLAIDIPWQVGDVVLVDNVIVMHGRRTFTGTRKILASLASPIRIER